MKTHKLTRRYLLTKVKKLILEEPKRLDMLTLLEPSYSGEPACGTVGCIAGWTLVAANLKGKTPIKEVIAPLLSKGNRLTATAKLLGLSMDEQNRLFFLHKWPADLETAYDNARTPLQRARVTARRIDLFLKSGGKK
jgi:hypothetical protein